MKFKVGDFVKHCFIPNVVFRITELNAVEIEWEIYHKGESMVDHSLGWNLLENFLELVTEPSEMTVEEWLNIKRIKNE